jgi:ubiquinone biosynthesis protein
MAQARAAIEAAHGQPVEAIFAELRPAGRGRLDRPGPSRPPQRDGRVASSRSRSSGPAFATASARDLATYFNAQMAGARSPEARRLKPSASSTRWRARSRSRWTCGSRRPLSEMPRTYQGRSRLPRAEGGLAADGPRVRAGPPNGSTASEALRRRGLRAAGHDLAALGRNVIQSFLRHAMRDGFFHADMHQGNLFVDARASRRGRWRHHGPARPKERRFLAEILLGFITRDYRRVAEVHFEAGYVPAIIRRRFRPGDPRHWRADPRQAPPTRSRWRSC